MPPQLGRKAWIGAPGGWVVGVGCVGMGLVVGFVCYNGDGAPHRPAVGANAKEGIYMSEPHILDKESPAVQAHMTILQGIIGRMGDNSRFCKVWCVTLAYAILVLIVRVGDANHAFMALLPTALFFVTDAYYLGLERSFRREYNKFVAKIHKGQYVASDLYIVPPPESLARGTLEAMIRFSVLPFYALVAATLLLAWWLIS